MRRASWRTREASEFSDGSWEVYSESVVGTPAQVLLQKARNWHADCIFVGSRGFNSTLERFRAGSVSTALVTYAPCSVEIVRA
jgi:nucleotide-binding universal stress UspA family protein